jgi:WD40-like Beta Propeller Repeat
MMSRHNSFTAVVLTALLVVSAGVRTAGAQNRPAADGDPLQPWCQGVLVHPVSDEPGRHTIHSYYVCNPESPDGRRVLYYASTDPAGHQGVLCIRDRETGRETVLARDVNVEDAHRAACQQWISGGSKVAFHDVRNGRWLVAVIDIGSLEQKVLIRDRQLAFGQPAGGLLPIYGCHWNPGDHRDLELVDVNSGDLRTVVTAEAVRLAYGTWIRQEFGDPAISIFFPVLSPDHKRVFFKIARGSGGDDFRSQDASHREGLIGYELQQDRFLFLREKWGHPAWYPDSRRIIEVGNVLIDSDDGAVGRIPDLPKFRGSHPSVSPDGALFVTDAMLDNVGGKPGEWGVVVGDLRGGRYQIVHRFDNSHGARSWRKSDPHPVFSADGRRIYFNVSSGDWTQLHVAEAGNPNKGR